MQQADIILALRYAINDEKALVNVIRALKSDNLIWNALQDPSLLDACIQKAQGNPFFWKPCNIALLLLEWAFPNNALILNADELSPEFRNQAVKDCNDVFNWHRNSPELINIAIVATTLHHQFEETIDEGKSIGVNFPLSGFSQIELSSGLKTLFAVLYGLVPNENQFFQEVIAHLPKQIISEIVTHIILTQPLNQEDQLEVLYRVVDMLPLKEQVDLVHTIKNHGFDTLSLDLGNHCLSLALAKDIYSSEKKNRKELDLTKIREMESLADLFQLSGQNQKSVDLFAQAAEAMTQWNKILLAKKDQGINGKDFSLSDNPIEIAIHAILTLPEAEVQQVETNALKVDELLNADFQVDLPSIYHRGIFKTIERLIDLGLWKNGFSIFNKIQKLMPAGKEIAKLGYSLNTRIENHEAALDYLGILMALDPADITIQREFAIILEKIGRLDNAYKEWKTIISHQAAIPDDFEKAARLAIRSNDFQNALTIGIKLLKLNPLNGFGLGVVGFSQFKMGNKSEAQDYLHRSVEIDPDNPQTWLWSVEIIEDISSTVKAEQILSQALQFLPNNPELNFKLAKILISREAFTEALPFVRKASEFLPDSLTVTLELLEILETLGLLGEEQKLLLCAVDKWPKNTELAHLHCRQLINMGKYVEALPHLQFVLSNSQQQGSFFLELSKAIIEGQRESFAPLKIENDLYSAAEIGMMKNLETSLTFEERYYHAELLLAEKKFEPALSIFKDLFQFSESNNSVWRAKIQVGIGEISFQEEQYETALISLKEASGILTDSIRLHKLLVEVFTKLNFTDDADRCAEKLYMDHQNDFEACCWFAGFFQKTGRYERAAEIYEKALTIQSENVDVILKLANIYRLNEENNKSKETLARILKINIAKSVDKKEAAIAADRIDEVPLAIELLVSAKVTSPDNDPDLVLALSHLYLKQANFEKAREIIEVYLGSNPNNAILAWKLSEIEEILGNHDKAVELLTSVLKEIQTSDQSFSIPLNWVSAKILPVEQVAIKFTETNIYTHLGDLHNKAEAINDSLIDYMQAVKCDQNNFYALHKAIELDDRLLFGADLPDYGLSEFKAQNDEEKINLAEIYAINAHHYMDEGNYEGAKTLLEKALKLSEQDPYVRAARIRNHVELESEKSAFDEYQALRVYQSPNVWIPIAAAEVGDWDDAIKRSREYVRLSPHEARGWLHLAKILVLYKENCEFFSHIRSNSMEKVENIKPKEIKTEFITSISQAESLSNDTQILYWKRRGMEIFEPNATDVLIPNQIIATPEEALNKTLVSILANHLDEALEFTFLFPKFPKTMILRAICLIEKNPLESVKVIQEAIKSHPESSFALAGAAIVFEKMGNLSQARDALEQALLLREDDKWDSWCSEISLNLGDMDSAVSHLSDAILIDSENIDYAFRLSELHLQMRHPELAISTWEKYPLPVDNNSDVQKHLAKIYAALGEIGKTGICLGKAIQSSNELPHTLIFASELMHECGDLQQAFEFARQALNADSSNSQAWIQLSRVISQKTSPAEGLQILVKAEQRNVNDSMIQFEKARLTKLLYGENKALPLFEKTFNENPDFVEVIMELAEIYYKLGFSVKANEMADLAIKAGCENWFIHYISGSNAEKEGQLDLAMKHLYESIKMNPVYLNAYLTLIGILQKRRDFSLAIQICKSAIENLPAEKEPYLIALQMLRDGKDYAGAEQVLRKLLEICPGDIALKRQLGALIALNMVVNV